MIVALDDDRVGVTPTHVVLVGAGQQLALRAIESPALTVAQLARTELDRPCGDRAGFVVSETLSMRISSMSSVPDVGRRSLGDRAHPRALSGLTKP
jgi:hypothetical protein